MASSTSLERNSEWFQHQNLSDFAGQWVCVVDEKVVAQHADLDSLVRLVKDKTKGKTPFIVRVPEGYLTV